MKSPRKPYWFAFWLFTIAGILTSLWLNLTTADIVTFLVIFKIVSLSLVFSLLGFWLAITSSSIYHHQVANPADPKNLQIGQTYWLNGETWAIYRGQNEFSGKYGFNFYGLGDIEDIKNAYYIAPGYVRLYISLVQEVPVEK
ncbi:MAG TPA: hypothetical protein VLH94_04075 [Spirochaetia bacterium]|nr:hypothetical protein [Spirochaetia bacterium]